MGGIDTGTKRLRAYQRRAAANRREHRDREVGSSGVASPCRVIDPKTGPVIGEFAPIKIEVPAGRLTFDTTPLKVHLSNWKDGERQHEGGVLQLMGSRRKLDGQDRRRPGGSPVNLSTLRSRKARDIERCNRRDPVRAYTVRLPMSVTDKIIVLVKPICPEVRDGVFSQQAWDDIFSEVLKGIIVEAIASKKL